MANVCVYLFFPNCLNAQRNLLWSSNSYYYFNTRQLISFPKLLFLLGLYVYVHLENNTSVHMYYIFQERRLLCLGHLFIPHPSITEGLVLARTLPMKSDLDAYHFPRLNHQYTAIRVTMQHTKLNLFNLNYSIPCCWWWSAKRLIKAYITSFTLET